MKFNENAYSTSVQVEWLHTCRCQATTTELAIVAQKSKDLLKD